MLSDSYTCDGQTHIEDFLEDPADLNNESEVKQMGSNLSRGGIAYDLKSSPFRYNVIYYDDRKEFPDNLTFENNVTFVFSSKLYRHKFLNQYKNNRKKINGSLSKRFGVSVEFNLLADLKLYTSIEKRGFLIYKNGEGFDCLSNITLDGEKLTRTL